MTTTTDIGSVPPACAALWAPYDVTKVPPANLTDSTPIPPVVVNATNGAVNDAEARAWALAANRAGVWLQWSEANDQYGLTTRIEGPQVVNTELARLMRAGVAVTDPACDIYANRYALFPVTAGAEAFFRSYGEATADTYLLEESYPGPCSLTARYPDGRTATLFPAPTTVISLAVGALRNDPLMGDIWYISASGFCSSRGAPVALCRP